MDSDDYKSSDEEVEVEVERKGYHPIILNNDYGGFRIKDDIIEEYNKKNKTELEPDDYECRFIPEFIKNYKNIGFDDLKIEWISDEVWNLKNNKKINAWEIHDYDGIESIQINNDIIKDYKIQEFLNILKKILYDDSMELSDKKRLEDVRILAPKDLKIQNFDVPQKTSNTNSRAKELKDYKILEFLNMLKTILYDDSIELSDEERLEYVRMLAPEVALTNHNFDKLSENANFIPTFSKAYREAKESFKSNLHKDGKNTIIRRSKRKSKKKTRSKSIKKKRNKSKKKTRSKSIKKKRN